LSKEEILQAGIAAAKSGDLQQAASLFAQVVKIDPSSEDGWLWLGMYCSTSNQRSYCYRRVLGINTRNLEAKEQLERLSKSTPIQPPAWASQAPPANPVSTPKPASPVAPAVPPFKYDDEEPVDTKQDELLPPQVAPGLSKTDQPKMPDSQRKKSNTKLILALILGPTLVVCILAIPIFIIFRGTAGFPLSSPSKVPTQAFIPTTISSPTIAPPTAILSSMPTVVYTPLLESISCPFDIPADANVTCGYLVVPEDRTGDPSHTIKLAVAVYHSQNQNPAEPVIFLQGGPGAQTRMISLWLPSFRNVILLSLINAGQVYLSPLLDVKN